MAEDVVRVMVLAFAPAMQHVYRADGRLIGSALHFHDGGWVFEPARRRSRSPDDYLTAPELRAIAAELERLAAGGEAA